MKNPDRIFTISAAVIAASCVGLRLWGLTDSCMWFDEIFGVHAAEHNFGGMLWFVAQDLIHPPLFYVLLKGWIAVGGESLFWLRTFSLVFACASLAPFLMLCKELKLTFTARIIALVFFAANGSLIKYAQEMRMYGPMLFLSLVSTWLFARFFYRGKNIWLLTLVNILLVYTHYFGWFAVLAQIAAIFIFQRVKIRHVLIMLGILLTAYIPWVWAILQAASAGSDVEQNIGWIQRPGISAVIDFGIDLVEPFYFQANSIDVTSVFIISIPLLLIIAIAKTGYLVKWRHAAERSTVMLLSVLIAAPLLAALILSWILPFSIWGSRHLIIIFPLAMILIGVLVDAMREQVLRIFAFTALGILFAAAFAFRMSANSPEPIWCTWERQAQNISASEPATVYVFEDLVAYHLWFATRERRNVQIVKVNGMPGMEEDKAYFLPRGFDGVRLAAPDEMTGANFAVAFRDMELNEKHPPLDLLTARGFKIGKPAIIDVGGLKSILVDVSGPGR